MPKTNRAYSTFEVKSINEDMRIVTGLASTPSTDRMDDIVEPMGAQFKLPLPMLWQHNSHSPIGQVTAAKATPAGITVTCQFAKVDEPPSLKDELDRAWAMVKAKLVRGFSIGFSPIESTDIEGSWGRRFTKWEWLELSAVTIPANADCSIQTIKSIDTATRAALGLTRGDPDGLDPPGVSGTTKAQPAASGLFVAPKGKTVNMTIAEQIAALENKRAATVAQSENMRLKAATAGVTFDAAEAQEWDGLAEETARADADLVRLKAHEVAMQAKATPVDGSSQRASTAARSGHVIVRGDAAEKFKGQNYVRQVIAKAAARLDGMEDMRPSAVAEQRWGKTNPTLVAIMKANEVAGGGSGAGEWGSELVTANNRFTGDFIEFLYSRTVYDQLPLFAIPANVQVKGEDGEGTGYWVGESKTIPATAFDYFAVNLSPLKVAALAVISNELIRDSSPEAEMLVRNGLVKASSKRTDLTFISAAAAVAGISPAGILNGLVAIPASGTTSDALRADIKSLYAQFIAAHNATGLQFVTTPSLAKSMQLMRNALGQTEFPDVKMMGGMLEGDPMVTGDNVGAGLLVLLNPNDIYRIGDTGVQVSVSRDAMIEQSSAPTGATDTPVGASQVYTSMFQSESTAIKIVRSINFAKRRGSAVAYVSGAAYSS